MKDVLNIDQASPFQVEGQFTSPELGQQHGQVESPDVEAREIAAEIATLNRDLKHAGRPYVLIGPGRWGSADHWLGIPVTWEQISSAKVIVETTLGDFMITSSQGTHFFQNLTSLRVGYLAVNPAAGEGHLDWDWLAAQPACEETQYLRHLRLAEPLVVRLDGRHRHGVIYKPGTTN